MNKNFLATVLGLAAFGMLAKGSVVEYCAGTNPVCATFNQALFNNDILAANLTFQQPTPFTFDPANISAGIYTDSTTGLIFTDFPSGPLSVSGTMLTSPNGDFDIAITIPAIYTAIVLDINVGGGLCSNYCAEGQHTGFLAFINNGSPTNPWTVDISPLGNGFFTELNSFNVASAGTLDSETPEVGTLILIGSGLMAMRWMRQLPRRYFRTLQTA
jgi:hypothetical protein